MTSVRQAAHSWSQAETIVSRNFKEDEIQAVALQLFNLVAHRAPIANPFYDLVNRISETTGKPRREVERAWSISLDLCFASRVANDEIGMPRIKDVIRRCVARLTGDTKTEEEIGRLTESFLDLLIDVFVDSRALDLDVKRSIENWRTQGLKIIFVEDSPFTTNDLQAICRKLGIEDSRDFYLTSCEVPTLESLRCWFETKGLSRVACINTAELYPHQWTFDCLSKIDLFCLRKTYRKHRYSQTTARNLSPLVSRPARVSSAIIKTILSHPAFSPFFRAMKPLWRK